MVEKIIGFEFLGSALRNDNDDENEELRIFAEILVEKKVFFYRSVRRLTVYKLERYGRWASLSDGSRVDDDKCQEHYNAWLARRDFDRVVAGNNLLRNEVKNAG